MLNCLLELFPKLATIFSIVGGTQFIAGLANYYSSFVLLVGGYWCN